MKRLVLVLVLAITATAQAKPVEDGSAQLAFDNAFGLSLVKLGIAPTVLAPAKQEGVTFTLPIRRGQLTGRRANLRTRGGFTLLQSRQQVELALSNLQLRIRGKRVTMLGFARLSGRPLDSFVFAEGTARRVDRTRTDLALSGIRLKLSDIGSTALNSQFSTTRFQTGQPIGTAQVSAGTAAR